MAADISIIGAGNLAWHLAPALDNAGYAIREVYSRSPKHARELSDRLYNAQVAESLDFSSSPSQIFILCIPDDAIEAVVRELVLPDDALLVHTSAGKSRLVLELAAAGATGVFYPLQTFSKGRKIDFRAIPIFIEGDSKETEKILTKMAKAISRQVIRLEERQRLILHVAAVFASNFTNHLLLLAHHLMQENRLNTEWLNTLIAETINKAMETGPENAQTGPAKRGDLETLDKHMELLKDYPELAGIYKAISQDILNRYDS